MGLLRRIQSRLELRRLEKKYSGRRRSESSSQVAQYVDGEYIFPTSTPNESPHSPTTRDRPQTLVSSSMAYETAEGGQKKQTPPMNITPWSQPADQDGDSVPPLQFPHTPTHAPSISIATTKHSSWNSLGTPSTATSTSSNNFSPPSTSWTHPHHPPRPLSANLAISRNSRGQTWEPPKSGWGSHGTDAFQQDRRDFRFDVEKDRRSLRSEG